MMGTAVGMIRPAQVLVIGIGIAGLQAIATAKRLGAVAHATDIRPDACEQGKSLGAKIIDLGIPPEIAVAVSYTHLQVLHLFFCDLLELCFGNPCNLISVGNA